MFSKIVSLVITFLTVQLFVLLCNAQATSVPDCASGCVQMAANAVGCQVTDTVCLCQASGFISTALTCASGTCQPDDQARSSAVLGEMCNSEQTTSGTPGTSTGTFSGTRSGSLPSGRPTSTSSSASGSPSSVVATGPGTSTSVTVRPSLSLTTLTTVPITVPTPTPTTNPSSTPTASPTSASVSNSSSGGTSTAPMTTIFSTSTQGPNGISTAPPGQTVSQTSDAVSVIVGIGGKKKLVVTVWSAAAAVMGLVLATL
ncbi:hypothetical protein D9758_015624 [Tetrapyrgos nigripes]|uniref:CFEM domain-containing protein n=1 Tax=Tetrapyrgos nigripes TaxID=182062 RepID=A0A8H5CM54_9AGAR|nr:hypothetical protein D9758_015624 [Tetrapyrgos nigripes]